MDWRACGRYDGWLLVWVGGLIGGWIGGLVDGWIRWMDGLQVVGNDNNWTR